MAQGRSYPTAPTATPWGLARPCSGMSIFENRSGTVLRLRRPMRISPAAFHVHQRRFASRTGETSGYGDTSRLCRLGLWQRQGEDTVFELRIDLLLVNDTTQRERTRVRADVVLRVNRLEPFVLREVDPALDAQNPIFECDGDVLLLDARHFHHKPQRVVRLVNVSARDVVARRRRRLGTALRLQFLFLLHGQLLFRISHRALHRLIAVTFTHATVIVFGLSRSERGRKSASTPSRHSARTRSASISTGTVRARS